MKNILKAYRISALLLAMVAMGSGSIAGAGAQATEAASKYPAMVMIIRHAEKPLGDSKNGNLSPEGFKRAQAIPWLFLQQPGSTRLPRFPRPDALFATDVSGHSERPLETITPLAQVLKLHVNHDYSDAEVGPLAKEVTSGKYAGKVVLIAWHHSEIPRLAKAFGVKNAPKTWDDTVFDKVWLIDWSSGEPELSILSQKLMPGDSLQ